MTAKDRRKVKHSLKTNIDKADIWLKLAIDLGPAMGINDEEFKDQLINSKETIISELTTIKTQIVDNFSAYISEIDNAISNLK